MKIKLINVFLFLIIAQYSFSQISNGFWQEKTSNISDSYLGGYHFVNSDFEYTINGYDCLNPILAFGGKYVIQKGNIIFTIKYMKKVIGGQLCRSETCTLNDSWAIEGGKVTKVKLEKTIKAIAKIEIHSNYLLIDKQKYFKIDEN